MIGFSADVLLKYQFNKAWGVSLLVGGSINRQDEAHLRNEIKQHGTDNRVINTETHSWKAYKIMPGIYYSVPLYADSRFGLKPMISAGICKQVCPV